MTKIKLSKRASHRDRKESHIRGISKRLLNVKNNVSRLTACVFFRDKGESNIRPKTNKILKILDPKTLAMAKLGKFFIEERVETAHSGAEVPIPNNTTPIEKGFMWNLLASKTAFFTNNSAPPTRPTRPKMRVNKCKISKKSPLVHNNDVI